MGRLILVSNRLPVTVRRGREGVHALIRSSGGMVAALGPVYEAGNGIWLGNIGDRLDANVEVTLERIGTFESRVQVARTARTILATRTPQSVSCASRS